MRSEPALLIALIVSLTACGGEEDEPEAPGLGGTAYEITTHLLSTEGCDDLQPIAEGARCSFCFLSPGTPYFGLNSVDLLQPDAIEVEPCDRLEDCPPAGSDEEILLNNTLDQQEEEGHVLYEGSASGSRGSCGVTLTRTVLSVTEAGVRITRTQRVATGVLAPPGQTCGDFLDEPPPDDRFTCEAREVIEGELRE